MEIKTDDLSRFQLLVDVHPPMTQSARHAPRHKIAPPAEEAPVHHTGSPRRRTDRHEVAPGQIPYQVHPSAVSIFQKLSQQSQMLSQVKADEAFIEELDAKTKAYKRAAATKHHIHHLDYDDHFSIPLQYPYALWVSNPR
jgi:hypothetical protein